MGSTAGHNSKSPSSEPSSGGRLLPAKPLGVLRLAAAFPTPIGRLTCDRQGR